MNVTSVRILILLVTVFTAMEGTLRGQTSLSTDRSIPQAIVIEAQSRKIPLNTIVQRGDEWIACIKSGANSETCIVLGKRTEGKRDSSASPKMGRRLTNLRFGDRLIIDRFGLPRIEYTLNSNLLNNPASMRDLGNLSMESDLGLTFVLANSCEAKVKVANQSAFQIIDALPQYKREGPQLVRTSDVRVAARYMKEHPRECFMVIVTVPSQCEPCRRFESIVEKSLETGHANSVAIKTFVLEYFSFQDAQQEVIGAGATFPATMFFEPEYSTRGRTSPKLIVGQQNPVSQGASNRTIEASLGRGVPSALAHGVIAPETLKMLVHSVQKNEEGVKKK